MKAALTPMPLSWMTAADGFALCRDSLAEILLAMGIHHTGISERNPQDVEFYYDDWYLFLIPGSSGLVKMREQEHDYIPGFSDRDTPGVTVSFIPFREDALWTLEENKSPEALRAFVKEFRTVTDLPGQHHGEALQTYFSDPKAKGPYIIASAYVEKLLSLPLAFPDDMDRYTRRLKQGIGQLNALCGGNALDMENRVFCLSNPPSHMEKQLILAAHSGNLSVFSFAAEVKFHADALVGPISRLPVIGRRWYASAIRADLTAREDGLPVQSLLAPYYRERGRLVKEQRKLHGEEHL